jgi:dUTP pyrophosphatase
MKSVKIPILMGSPIPQYKTPKSAGCDLAVLEDVVVRPNQTVRCRTNVRIAVPDGYFGFVKERGSTADKCVIATAGIGDGDYRGEWFILLANIGEEVQFFKAGTRVANLIIIPFVQAEFVPTESLEETERGEGAFGSTGER